MDTDEFDSAVIGAFFKQAGLVGWREANLVDAARSADLDIGRLRARFPGKTAVLLRFGRLADQAALSQAAQSGLPRERLFDLVMARFDQLQQHRAGVLALIDSLRTDPGTSLLLYAGTLRSMRWLLQAAEIPSDGPLGFLRVQGLVAIWIYALRAWEKDESVDMSATMAALDRGLDRAVQAEDMLPGRSTATPQAEMMMDPASRSTGSAVAEPPPILPGGSVAGLAEGPAVL